MQNSSSVSAVFHAPPVTCPLNKSDIKALESTWLCVI